MSARRHSPMVIRRRDQVEALVSPIRQEVVDAVAAAGPSTIAQIAGWLGRRPDTLYYHISALAKVGLLIEAGRVRAGRRFGVVYDVPGRPMRLDYEGTAGKEAVVRVVRASLRLADRDFARAMRATSAVTHGPNRDLWGGRVKGWVHPDDLPEVNRLIERLSQLVQGGKPRTDANLQSFTYVLTRVGAKAKAPSPAANGSRKIHFKEKS